MSAIDNVLFITGLPGIGKTTIIKKVVRRFSDRNIAGFFTEEIRSQNSRLGFELVTLDGQRLVMAHVDSDSAIRVGKYGVDVDAIDRGVAMALPLTGDAEVFIIDEIGKMECYSDLFVQRMTKLLESGRPLVATVARKGDGFIAAVKRRPGVELWELTKRNRDAMADKVTNWLSQRLV